MNSCKDCLIGSELHAIAKDIRYNIKMKLDILPEYNNKNAVLKENGQCIIKRAVKLTDEEYAQCLKTIREKGLSPIEDIERQVEGKRVYCEYSVEPRKLKIPGRQQCILKSKIALGYLSTEYVPSGVYHAGQRFIKL